MFFRPVVSFAVVCVSVWLISAAGAGDEKKSGKSAEAPAKKAVEETVEVKLKDLTLTLPKSWSQSDVVNNMRLATYEIPAAEGDREKGELTVSSFAGGGGSVELNLKRWVDQFDAEGSESVIKQGTIGDNTYHIAEISGTYQKSVGPPVLQKKEPMKGYRMLGVILSVKDQGVYFLKLTGPDATVKASADALRASFGAKSEGEEDFEI